MIIKSYADYQRMQYVAENKRCTLRKINGYKGNSYYAKKEQR